MRPAGSGIEGVVARVHKRAWLLAGLGIAVAFAIGWRSGVSLTITAAVVIFSFLVLEKLIGRIGLPQKESRSRASWALLLVTFASFGLLALVLWRWKGFDPLAGAAGLSVVVLAVVAEIFVRE